MTRENELTPELSVESLGSSRFSAELILLFMAEKMVPWRGAGILVFPVPIEKVQKVTFVGRREVDQI